MKATPNQKSDHVTSLLADNLEKSLYIKAEEIRQWLLDTPGISEAVKYKIPFYDFHGPLIYFNPQKDHLIIGFTKGTRIEDPFGLLIGDQKQIRHFMLDDIVDFRETLPFYIDEAIRINKILKK
ncbi:DUF1801 domain-containing protein [Mangrovivirga cuniculi]|uniref:YdhG-like domain-containing protein n=1 Tax=Mangrovivirga cuniculi TaxID=2715131 RepID=A0A4D7JXM5_9BACT|nr:DUF1801 domain-containing protein [Mangrovivirga cuniculi]QCK16916.1 hypothetical protein DCC35_20370 [Mangrovivirga cuniculi]